MLGSFTGMLAKLKESKTVQSIAGNISHNYQRLKGQVLRQFAITQVLPQLYHCSFPEPDSVAQLKAHIKNNEFQIWNVSEYAYEESVEKALLGIEQGEVHHLCLAMYSNLPFYELVLSLSTIHRFLQAAPNNRVYIHCQDSRVRSALLIACYLYKYREGVEDISEAVLLVNRLLKVQLQEPEGNKHNNIHILLKNFVNYLHDYRSINPHQLTLLKVIFSNIPLLEVDSHIVKQPRISIEVKRGDQLVAKKVVKWEAVEGEMLGVGFEGKEPLLSDQFLMIVKYISGGRAYNMMRIQLNTNFIYDNFTRVQQQDIDTSDYAFILPQALTYIDFIFQSSQQLSKLATLEHAGLSGNLEKGPEKIIEKKQEKKVNKEQQQEQVKKEKEQRRLKKEQAIALEREKAAQAEREKAHEEAIAQLQQAVQDITDQDSTTIDLAQQITQKITLTLASKPLQQAQKSLAQQQEEDEEEEDLDDYLSKLQQQA